MKFKLGMFDLNGTVLDDLLVAYKAVVAIFQNYNLPVPTLEEYRSDLDSEDVMNFYRKHRIPQSATLDELNLIYQPVIAVHTHEANLAPHIEIVLDQCKRLAIKTMIVSATKQETLEQQVAKFGILDKFNRLCGGAWKKGPIFRALIEEFKINPREAFYIDDTFDCLQTAKKVGIYTIGYTRGYNSFEKIKAADPDEIVDSFFDVMEIIENGGE